MNADERLEKLFATARNAKPEMNIEILEQKLDLNRNRTTKYKIYFKTKIVLAMSIIAVISTVLVLYFNNSNPKLSMDLLTKTEQRNVPRNNTKREFQPELKTPKNLIGENIKIQRNKNRMAQNFAFKINDWPNFDSLTPINKFPVFDQKDSITQSRSINLNSIKVIELSDEELLAFGIKIENKGINVPMGNGLSGSSVLSKDGSTFEFKIKFNDYGLDSFFKAIPESKRRDSNQFKSSSPGIFNKNEFSSSSMTFVDEGDSLFGNKVKNKVYPKYSLITDDLGQKWRIYELDDGLSDADRNYMRDHKLNYQNWEKAINGRKEGERKLIEKIPSFVPVLVRSGDINIPGDTISWRADIIIWFEPSEELFNALPTRISSDLRKEYQSVFVTKNGEAKTCKYFEACQNTPGAIQYFSAFPNPTDGELTVEFSLSDTRAVDANIYTINGMLVKKAYSNKNIDLGKYKFETHLGDLSPGVYILVIESDKGDIISRRIVRR